MANIKSQEKRNRQNEVRRQRNKSVMSDLKTAIKKAQADESSQDDFRAAQAKIDTAVSKGVLHKRTAARMKSRLTRRVAS